MSRRRRSGVGVEDVDVDLENSGLSPPDHHVLAGTSSSGATGGDADLNCRVSGLDHFLSLQGEVREASVEGLLEEVLDAGPAVDLRCSVGEELGTFGVERGD